MLRKSRTDPTLTATVTGVVEGDTLNYTLSRVAGQNVDEYDITVTLGSNPNYTVTATGAKFTITPKAASVTADAKSKVYDNDASTDPTLTATVTGVVEGDTLNYTLSRVAGQNVGAYDITVTLGENPNYTVSTTGATFTITKADPTFVAPEPLNPAYTGEAQALVTSGSTEDGTILFSTDGENFSETIPTATEIGIYEVWYMVKGDANHNDTEPVMLTVAIALTIYGADVSSLDIAFVENGERLYRYDVCIKNIPEGFEAVGMQVFLSYDNELLTLKRVESDFDWVTGEVDNNLLLAWATDNEETLTEDQVLFSLIFAAAPDAAGEETALPFIANIHDTTSTVSALVDGEIVEYTAATIDGEIRFAVPFYGDANCDGRITGADAALILSAIVGNNTLTAQGAFNADVDGDLEVTAEDAALILRWIVGLIETFPVAAQD